MTKTQGLLRSNNREPHWGVLAREPATKTFRRPDNFISLLQAQYPKDKVPGKTKPGQPSKDIIV